MRDIYQNILVSISKNEKLLAVLIDPDKMSIDNIETFTEKVNASRTTHIFVGGSTVEEHATEVLVNVIKTHTNLPVLLFPGDVTQITNSADGLLFLSLISGRNADYLIGKHVQAMTKLRATNLEIISTGYLLIEGGKETAVQRVTNTNPMLQQDIIKIVNTAKAGELLGMKSIYLEAGSGAVKPVSKEIILAVKQDVNIPLIVGGGIKNRQQLHEAYASGADLVVIGTAIENDTSFLNEL